MKLVLYSLGPHGEYGTLGALLFASLALLAIAIAWPPIWWATKLVFGWWFTYWQFG